MDLNLFWGMFLYAANWNWRLNLVFIAITLFYLIFTGPKVPGRQKSVFVTAMLVYYFALGSPLDLIGHDLFSMHMLQMSLLYFVLPPLLLLGIPAYFWLPLLRVTILRKIGRFFTKPIITLFAFNGLISVYHVPYIFNSIMGSYALHIVSHLILLLVALAMWWPIIAPIPTYDRLKPIHKLGLIFANGILLTPACAMITFTNTVLFKQYAKLSELAPIITPIHDQQLGGIIMKIVQEVVYIAAIVIILKAWFKEERNEELKHTP